MVWVKFNSERSNRAHWLGKLPSNFDEFIILPLPFFTGIVVDAYSQDPIKTRKFVDYLVTSTYRKKAAINIMATIAMEEMWKCDSIGRIVSVANSLNWLPQPYPKEIGLYLPQLLEIAQGVKVAQESTSLHRRHELLAQPLGTIARMFKDLAFYKKRRLAAQWIVIAKKWQSVLESHCVILADQIQQSGESLIPQVYVAGGALNPQQSQYRFKGRTEMFRRLEEIMLAPQPPILLLLGRRRTGKSSSLNYLPEKMGPGWVPLVVDGQGLAATSSLVTLAEQWVSMMIAEAQKNRYLRLFPPSTDDLQNDPFGTLLAWMGGVEKVVPGKRFLLCVDEFERLSSLVEQLNNHVPLNFLRHVAQHSRNWVVLFSGSHAIEELPPYWSDYLINAQTVRISFLEENEAVELIRYPIPNFNDIYSEEAVNHILHLTHNHPYLIQLLGTMLVENLNQSKNQEKRKSTQCVTREDVDDAVHLAFERGSPYFNEWWQECTSQEQDFLYLINQNEKPEGQDRSIIHRLVRREIVQVVDGHFSFRVPMMQRYVAKLAAEVGF